MRKRDVTRAADPQIFGPYIRENQRQDQRGHEVHAGPQATERRDTYRGHEVVIRTRYEIEVDGRLVAGHLEVGKDGRVHYHPLPNYSFPSAVDLVRELIDSFPEEFENPIRPPGGGHDHGGGH